VVCKTPNVPLFFTRWSYHIRYDHDQHRRWRRRNGTSIVSVSASASASPLSINQMNMDSSSRRLKNYQEVDLYTIFNTLSCLSHHHHHTFSSICCVYVFGWVNVLSLLFLILLLICLFLDLETIAPRLSSLRGTSLPRKSLSNPRTKTFLLLRYIWFSINDLAFSIIFLIIIWYLPIYSLFFSDLFSCVYVISGTP